MAPLSPRVPPLTSAEREKMAARVNRVIGQKKTPAPWGSLEPTTERRRL